MKTYTNPALLSVLRLTPPVDEETLKKTYRRLALRHHPDKTPEGDSERFIEITAAYQALLSTSQIPESPRQGPCYCDVCLRRAFNRALQRVPADIRTYFVYDVQMVGMVKTDAGERLLVTAAMFPALWQFWKKKKKYLWHHAFSVSKDKHTGEWRLCFWIRYP